MTMKSVLCGCVAVGGFLLAGQVLADCVKPAVTGEYGFSACKEWPAYPGLTLTARSQYEQGSTQGGGPQGTYDLDLAVLSVDQASPVATYHKAGAFASDAIELDELTLDTARYALTPELRAFGVRTHSRNFSSANPYAQTLLSLYVREGNRLRPVLENLYVDVSGAEWDGCAGDSFQNSRTVEIAKTRSHGYADLIVKTVASGTTAVGKGETCDEKFSSHTVLTTLRYDGKSYVVPAALKGM